MKSSTVQTVLFAAFSAAVLLFLSLRVRVVDAALAQSECARQQDICEAGCDSQAQSALNSLRFERNTERIENLQRLTTCNFEVDADAKAACRAEEQVRFAGALAALDAREAAIEVERVQCNERCAQDFVDCESMQSLSESVKWRKLKRELLGTNKPHEDPIDPRGD